MKLKGFILIEIIIMLVIIGIILALALPDFHRARLQVKANEMELTVEEVIEIEKKEKKLKKEERKIVKQEKQIGKRRYKDTPLWR